MYLLKRTSILLVIFLLVAIALQPVSPVYAATIDVDDASDAYAADGLCTLREAIINASEVYLREGRDFLNKGLVTQSGRARVRTDTAGATTTITNAAGAQWTSLMNDGYSIAWPYNPTATLDFANAGTLTKNGSGVAILGHSNGSFNLTNTGTIEVPTGELRRRKTSIARGPATTNANPGGTPMAF